MNTKFFTMFILLLYKRRHVLAVWVSEVSVWWWIKLWVLIKYRMSYIYGYKKKLLTSTLVTSRINNFKTIILYFNGI